MLIAIVYILFFVPYIFLISYYLKAWKSVEEVQAITISLSELPYISVVVAARNEAHHIEKCLQSLISQVYPARLFEIIVIDDHSEDATAMLVQSMAAKNDAVRLIKLSEEPGCSSLNSYKKKAIAMGIESAKGTLIVTTDADCIAPPLWLQSIGTCYVKELPDMIAAPVKFLIPETKNIFKKCLYIFQALDFMTLQGITGAAVQKKIHSMANGANLAYRKSVFEAVSGFAGIDGIASGDDMLLMEKFSFSKKIKYLKRREAIVTTSPEPTIKLFLNQRIRWAGKSSAYSDKKIKWIMGLVYLVNVWLLILGVAAIFSPYFFYHFLILLAVKFLTDLTFLFSVSSFFGQRRLLWWFIMMAPLHVLYVSVLGWLGAIGNYSWKGRKVK